MSQKWSNEQSNVFEEVKRGRGSVGISANPGSGKTTVLMHCASILPTSSNSIFLSFSNAIVDELRKRAPTHIRVSTLHSLGMSMLKSRYKTVKVEANKYFKECIKGSKERTKEVFKEAYRCQDVCTFARMTLTNWNDTEALQKMCNHYGVDSTPSLLEKSQALLKKLTKVTSEIDFADMVYLPAVDPSLVNARYQYVLWDEVQDSTAAQRLLVKNILMPGGRAILCGDPRQAIYGFSGSTVDSFDRVVQDFNAKVFPMNTSFRCAKAVVDKAKEVYDDIQAYELNPQGSFTDIDKSDVNDAQPGDFVLCRNTKPLIALFFNFVLNNKKAFVAGKDLEKGLLALAESCMAYDNEGILRRMDQKLAALSAELRAKNFKTPTTHASYISLVEKIEVIKIILDNIVAPGQLPGKIAEIFDETKDGIRLMTIHRSKGLEATKCFVVTRFNGEKLMPSKYAISDDELIQERNLDFVARTRAKKDLIFVTFSDQ